MSTWVRYGLIAAAGLAPIVAKATVWKRRALLESERRFFTIFDASPELMVVRRISDGRALVCNTAYASITGFRKDEIVGRTAEDIGIWQSIEDRDRAIEVLKTGRTVHGMEANFLRRDGSVWVGLCSVARIEMEGEPCALWMVTDITERKRAEEALRTAKETAEQVARTKTEFVNIASHELRTPLTALRIMAQLAARKLTAGDSLQREEIDSIITQVDRLSALINDLLDASRLDRGVLRVKKAAVDLIGAVKSTVSAFAPIARGRALHVSVPDAPVWVEADYERIEQVLGKYLDNAIKYSPAGAPIEIRLTERERHVEVSVEDSGPRIPAEEERQLFSRFIRLSSEATLRHPGLGLGLFITKEVIRQHGGEVGIRHPTPAVGNVFFFRLPKKAA